VAGDFTVQRTPRGLLNVIGNYGGHTPEELAANLVATVESLQFYGMQQQQSQFASNAAIATDTNLNVTVPLNQYWLLFHMFARCPEQAAMTYLDLALTLDPNQSCVAYQAFNAPPIAGRIRRITYTPPYPLLLLPGQRVGVSSFFAGVANADLALNAVVGVLG